MTGIDSYSTSPATNATATGGSVNYAEGQAPSTVNNTARQCLADIRSAFNDLVWFIYGTGDQGSGNLATPAVYASATSFTIAGSDVTTKYEAGRRVRAVGSSTGTIYGSISSSSYNGGNTTTTVNVTWDSGSLSNETLVVSLAQIPVTGVPVPSQAIKGTITNDSAATGVMGELLSSTVASPGTSLTTGVAANVTSKSLTAGDWDVSGSVFFTGNAATTLSIVEGSISATSATVDASNDRVTVGFYNAATVFASVSPSIVIGPTRVSLAATTTIYLVAVATFGVNTCTAYGQIRARRVR